MHSENTFLESLEALKCRINLACQKSGRPTGEVKLMAVTKTHSAEAANWAAAAGLPCIGENRVQEAATKRPLSETGHVPWELIGPLQSNKARLALGVFDRIQTIGRLKLVRVLDRICEEEGISSYPVLVQVNVGKDPAKSGCGIGDAGALAAAVVESSHLKLEGLMTIGEFSDDERVVRGTFSSLRELRDRLEGEVGQSLPELSMGMTHDLDWAIEEGSTLVRIGTALFGKREPYPPAS